MNFYKHYIGDFQRDTGHLGLTERGAYLALMHHYYATEQTLPKDHVALCRIAGAFTKPERDAVKVAMGFFEVRDGTLWHKRIEAELEKHEGRADTNRRIALDREARKRAENVTRSRHEPITNRAPDVAGTLHEPSTIQNHSHNHSSLRSEGNTPSKPAKSDGYAVEFEEVWIEYPQRTGHSKAEAYKAWTARLKAGEEVQTMLDGVRRYATYCQTERTEARFVKHAATFFGPDRHYLNDWTPAPRVATAQSNRATKSDRHAAWLAGVTDQNHGENQHDDRTVDAEARFV